MSPEKTENPTLKKVEKENLRLGKPITRAFLKANHGIIEELKRSLKNEPVSDCHGVIMYYRQVNREGEALPHCSKCHKPIQPSGEEGK